MNRRKALKTMAVGAAAAAVVAPQARAASKEVDLFARRWKTSKEFTLQVADAMPEDSYTFKPNTEIREFGKLMQHLALNNAFYIARFKGGTSPLKEPPTSDKESVKKILAESFDWCAEVIAGLTEEDLDKSYPGRNPNQPPQSGRDWVLTAFLHTAHTRGYADMYLRGKNLTPPRYMS
ncbi:MAG: DinB family protein [Acidobacteria bacterium]|nr:DinB family protein [Acidobacteriota bacterium]